MIEFKNGKSKPKATGNFPISGGNGILGYANNYNNENVIIIGRVGAYCGSLYRELNKCWISDNAISANSRNDANMYCFYKLNELQLNERSEGTGQPLITQGLLNSIRIIIPQINIILKFENIALTFYKHINLSSCEREKLEELKTLLLSKLSTIEN